MISGKELSRPRRLLAGGGQWGSVLVMLELLLATAGVNCAGLAAGLIGDLTVIRAGDGETSIIGLMIFSNIGFSFSNTLSVTGGTTLISSEMDEPLVIAGST